jgi:hypothetical protein
VKKIVAACAWVFPLPAMVVASFLTGNDQLGSVTAGLIFLYLIVGMTAGAAMLNSWLEIVRAGSCHRSQDTAARHSKLSRTTCPAMI